MSSDVKGLINQSEDKMKKALTHLDEALAHIRAGKANPRILDGVSVDYYGSQVPISQVSTITTPDARTITIMPWEKKMLQAIEKAIMAANIGLNPDNNGEIIRLGIPPLTEERRKGLVKQAKEETEDAKISIRAARRDVNDQLKKMVKDGLPEDVEKDSEAEVQKLTDNYIKKAEEMFMLKEKEILTV